ncbi:hypothetical protein PVL30_002749 [Lodderomyces elongisporus]|uniref:Uncharacterized protein n=1 Tax=Lodderomyces elongisporus (strain ATCC 11503 / CBS 2605 / JCM 1781 / NBRC 1676 / NRRL YB-4239) TaxID=379508 RepID=A5E0W6_LODEL|nr:uncharacterized protein PVL30_002749 [Lodderomyces elongisporus]EDK45074.1 conserved hypothetical protein [Lodderomyces elongisporus NRRL YB-4239]WLF79000.1 hypothetical protein PVL30_002749 [Lodderomyces elongisporus]
MEHPAFTLSGLCAIGGIMGYVRKGSLPSLIAGTAVSVLYGYSGYLLKQNANYGIELALGTSSILLVAGLARAIPTGFQKPVPLILLLLGSVSTGYYFKKYNDFYPIFKTD